MIKFLLPLWIFALCCGFGEMSKFEFTPGRQLPAPRRIEANIAVAQPTLYVFFHPQCSCSLATALEIERVQSLVGKKLNVIADIVVPESDQDWSTTPLDQRLTSNSAIFVQIDRGGKQAAAFGAATSGFAVLYGRSGQRVFQGGLTDSRGHQGESVGSQEVIDYVQNGSSELNSTPVFGCSLGTMGAQ